MKEVYAVRFLQQKSLGLSHDACLEEVVQAYLYSFEEIGAPKPKFSDVKYVYESDVRCSPGQLVLLTSDKDSGIHLAIVDRFATHLEKVRPYKRIVAVVDFGALTSKRKAAVEARIKEMLAVYECNLHPVDRARAYAAHIRDNSNPLINLIQEYDNLTRS